MWIIYHIYIYNIYIYIFVYLISTLYQTSWQRKLEMDNLESEVSVT